MNNHDDLVLDLHDIALLLNYERGIAEPRFRNTKLSDIAAHGADFHHHVLGSKVPQWSEATVPKTGFVFSTPKGLSRKQKEEPDLPSNMLLQPVQPHLAHLTRNDLELYYWQARNHDGCFKAIALFQHFIDLFPEDITRIRIRVVENNKPRVYTTDADNRQIVEVSLIQPKSMNMSCITNKATYLSGSIPVTDHAVLLFPPSTLQEEEGVILDLTSLQFGDVGRGFKGRGVFVLEPVQDYINRLDTFADENDYWDGKRSVRIRQSPQFDHYLKDVAGRAKERWDKRQTDPWCGHCGAPSRGTPLKRCGKCRAAHYCDAEHQLAAWQYHKHFCGQQTASST